MSMLTRSEEDDGGWGRWWGEGVSGYLSRWRQDGWGERKPVEGSQQR